MDEDVFSAIIGEQLSAVCFVQDYLQLQFDGPVLTAMTLPKVCVGDAVYSYDMPGYRDILCERIAKTVHQAFVLEGNEIRIEFDDRAALTISLKPEDYVTPEAAILTIDTDKWASW